MPKSLKKTTVPETTLPVVRAAKMKPAITKTDKAPPRSKQDTLVALLERAAGATVEEMAKATGWQKHSVLGTISGVLRKRLGLTVDSAVEPRGRVYRIA